MNIEDARRIKNLVIEYDAREEEIKRIENRLKYMPTDKIFICVKHGINTIHAIDEFEINKGELSVILTDMKRRRQFFNRNLEKELDRYATRYGEDTPWDDEDDLK